MRFPVPSRRRLGVSLAVPVGIVLSSLLVYQTSDAAFSAKTTNGSSSWASASVKLSLGGAAAQSISLTDMLPGVTYTKCVNIQYGGSVRANLRLYGSNYDDTKSPLGQYLTMTVEESSNAAPDAACTGFTSATQIYPTSGSTGTLKDFMVNRTNFTTGVGTSTIGGVEVKGYRFTFTVADDNAAQNTTAGATFVWEAQATN